MFVTGRYSSIVLSVLSLLLWGIGAFLPYNVQEGTANAFFVSSIGVYACRALSLLLYVGVAFIINSFIILEERTPWMAGLLLWLAALLPPLQNNLAFAMALLVFVVAVALLLSCCYPDGIERRIYAVFFIYSLSVLLCPQFLYLAPLFIAYPIMTGVLGIKSFLSLLLGAVTPFWLLYGSAWVLPALSVAKEPFEQGLVHISDVWGVVPTTPSLLSFAIVELLIMLPALYFFFTTSSPSKPVMRKMLAFFMLANTYLWLLSWVCGDSLLLFAWRLPGLALISAYLFTVKITKLSSIYFVLIYIMWLFVAAIGIWNG